MLRSASAGLVLAAAVLTLTAAPASAQQRVPTHVACVGDSITYGYLASSSTKSYPSDLQALFGTNVQVKNFGRNSATMLSTGDLPYINQTEYTNATTFVSGAGASAVVDVIIMLGTNDSKSYNWAPTAGSTRAQQFMTDCAAMVDHFTGLATHPVVYLALPPAIYTNSFGIDESVTVNQIDPIIMQVATQKGMPIIDIHTPTAGHPEDFQDGVHPTDAGYMLLAQLMHDALLRPLTGAGGAGGASGAGGAGGRGGAGGVGGAGGTIGIGGGGGGVSGRGGSGGSGGRGGGSGGGTAGRGGAAGAAAGAGGATGAAGTGGVDGGSVGGATGSAGAGGATGAGGGSVGGATGGATGTGGSGTAGATGAGGTGTAGGGATGVAGTGSGGTGAGGDSGGCGCSEGAGPRSSFAAFGIVLLAIARRRRRR
jgi:lysophospholipase L1-like esterase